MATARNDIYTTTSGGSIFAGISGPPTWANTLTLGQWGEISGTSGALGIKLNAYCGLAKLGSRWVSAATGGHDDSDDNSVVYIDLKANSPTWIQRKAPSTSTTPNVAYYADGKPSSRHTYFTTFGIEESNSVLLPGMRFGYGPAPHADSVDEFDFDTNQWRGIVPDAPGISGSGLADVSPPGYYPVVVDHLGNFWCILHTNGNISKYNKTTNTWSQPAMANKVAPNVRYPWALDTRRNQCFGLAWADGEGAGTGPDLVMRAVVLDYTAGTQRAITFDAGSTSAVNQFITDKPAYAGMDYDPINDRFLFLSSEVGKNRVFIITPNGTNVWSMSIQTGAGTLPVGVNMVKKFTYFENLGGGVSGFACIPDITGNIQFLRVT